MRVTLRAKRKKIMIFLLAIIFSHVLVFTVNHNSVGNPPE